MSVNVPGAGGIRNVDGTVGVLEEAAVGFYFTNVTGGVTALVSGVFEPLVGSAA